MNILTNIADFFRQLYRGNIVSTNVVKQCHAVLKISIVDSIPKIPEFNANPKRTYLLIQNNGVNDVFLNLGSKATINHIKIVAGGNFEPLVAPIDSIHLISRNGQFNTCVLIEGVNP